MLALSHWPIDILKGVFQWIHPQSIDACLLRQTNKRMKWVLTSEMQWQPLVNPNLTFKHDLMIVLKNLPPTSEAVLDKLHFHCLVNGDMRVAKLLPPGLIDLPWILAPIQYGHLECFKVVLAKCEQGGYARIAMKQKAFREACIYGQVDIASYLCHQYGVNVHDNQSEAINLACAGGHLPLVKFLQVRTGISYFLKDTPISQACEYGHLDVLKFLVLIGAKIKGRCGKRAISAAAAGGHLEIVKYLHSINTQLHLGKVLRNACNSGHLNVAKYAYSKGADVHLQDDDCIRLASTNGYLEVVQFLYSVGTDIHANNDAAFHGAVWHGRVEVIQFLHSVGVDVHKHNYIHEAMRCDRSEVITLLYALGATNPTMKQSIRKVCELGHLNVLTLLQSMGEDVYSNRAANLRVAQERYHVPVINYLKSLPISNDEVQ